jgi:hypothetical protein
VSLHYKECGCALGAVTFVSGCDLIVLDKLCYCEIWHVKLSVGESSWPECCQNFSMREAPVVLTWTN